MNSIKSKFIIFISMILCFSIGAVSLVSYYRAQSTLTTQMQDNLFELTKSSSHGISSMVKNNIAEVDSLVNDRSIVSLEKTEAMNRIDRDIQRLPQADDLNRAVVKFRL